MKMEKKKQRKERFTFVETDSKKEGEIFSKQSNNKGLL